MNEKYKFQRNVLIKLKLFLFFFLFSFASNAQTKTVTGVITSTENGETLIGVNVLIKGTANGVISDLDGKYSISVPNDDVVLIFSMIGTKNEEIKVGSNQVLNVKLSANSQMMDEVIVVGYGSQKKSELTSAVSSIKKEDIKVALVSNVSEALQGKTPGVEVINNSNSPGGDVSVRVRGISSLNNSIQPLYVVDGIPLSGNASFLNSNDIASVEILKDAAAASIYGSRGANGVVLITTIKGTANEKFSITADASIAFQTPTHMVKMMNPAEYGQMLQTFKTNDGSGLTISPGESAGAGTDWLNLISRSNAPLQNYNLSVSGGTKKVVYSSSLSYFNQQGVVKTSDFERFNYRLNTEANVTDKFKIGGTIVFTNSTRHLVPNEGDLWNSIFNNALTIDPITPVYFSATELAANAAAGNSTNEYSIYHNALYTNSGNPVGAAARNFKEEKNTNFFGTLFGSYEIVHGLTYKTSFGYEYNGYHFNNFNPEFYENPSTKLLVNSLTKNENTTTHFTSNNTLTYSKKSKDHSYTLLAGTAYEHYQTGGINAAVSGLPGNDPNYRYLTYGTSGATVSETQDESALVSFFGRAMYNFRSKYFLSASMRSDGSSKFAAGNKWGNFPSISGAWVMSKESFFENDVVSLLKLRVGWGKIGNQSIPSNAYSTVLRNNAYYNFGGNLLTPGYSIAKAGNPNVTWETTTDLNLGLDFGLLDDKLSGSVDVYNRKVSNLLLAIDPPMFTGLYNSNSITTGIITNVGAMQNKGIDLTLNYSNKVGGLEYDFGGVFSVVDNKVLDLGTLSYLDAGALRNVTGYAERTVVGKPIGQFYGYKVLGIFQNQSEINSYTRNGALIQPNAKPGDFKFGTNSGNTTGTNLVEADKQYLGSPLPKFTYGFNLKLKYKGFDLNAYFYGVYGNKILEAERALISNTNNSSSNLKAGLVEAAWHGEGTSNTVPKMTLQSTNNNFGVVSDAYLSDGSYLRLKNLNVGYELNKEACSFLNLNRFRVYVGAQNLFTITKYTGFDPAVSNSTVTQVGVDYGGYPTNRTFLMGFNIGL
ncbi:TonB-linked SusC/RagA family outer membrane protein [Flavobacterium sp. 90]|uniref:SusC/RagA family TonB-linked outer membrane protein n=1 Tax=unclassified Flavobacterium TaxID=196869 RepID=UPI000EAED9DE|nr:MULTISPECIES: TonB-dependent receptor [unclassified Flavobacterium]RKR08969.1 TonB-linked SusC/RagA family outer membrane protein [Flavobacterium sp. 81]TCK52757.1 TonB-linked SusC/RagA family outer membrane protein [Flavobacterium sp. 90]